MKPTEQTLLDLIDKPISTHTFKAFDQMVSTLGPYLNQFEVDQCIDFMYAIEQSKHDVNWSISDAKTQMIIILGEERYHEAVEEWKKHNQKLLSVFGTLKYKRISDGSLWDGLDPDDNPDEYTKIYI